MVYPLIGDFYQYRREAEKRDCPGTGTASVILCTGPSAIKRFEYLFLTGRVRRNHKTTWSCKLTIGISFHFTFPAYKTHKIPNTEN